MEEKEEDAKKVPPAKEIYVLMKNEYRISRNIRAQWFLNHLNKVLTVSPKVSKDECSEEIEIISAIPRSDMIGDTECTDEAFQICIVPETRVVFLSARYRLVFCLDLSPSVATVDSQHGTLFLDEVYPALKQSLESVCQPFCVPGSSFLFSPELHITVIAHVPNSPSGIPQVLIQGWVLNSGNVADLLEKLHCGLNEVAACVAKTGAKANEDYEKIRASSDCISASLLSNSHECNKMIDMSQQILTADISTLNLLRYGILALQLLPENSSAGIIVITDGVISFPNAQMQDSLLAQLRNSTISCSFLQIGSPYHPFSCFGRIPYVELMQFISAATCGACFPSTLEMVLDSNSNKPNAYHEAFLYWTFQTTHIPEFLKEFKPFPDDQMYWTVDNPHVYSVSNQSRVKKKHAEETLKVSLENVLSCRLREGYTVKSVMIDESKNAIEVRLFLPWNLSTNFEYIITSSLTQSCPRNNSDSGVPSCLFELIVDGCYEFLHDVTCSDKKPIKSYYRTAVIKQFWSYVKNLSHTDQILIQLHSFTQNPAHYTIPESIKNGVPLSYLPANSVTPVLSSKNMAHSPFTTFWRPLCMLDINVWQKWMHTHRIGVILQHDMPLPKNLHLPNASGRYVHIQCRQATTALNSLLRDYSSFVLVENHFYIKFLYNDSDKPPTSFYVIRVTSKAPCMVIRLAFLGGLPGRQRNEIVKDLREQICNLKLPKRSAKDYHHHSSQHTDSSGHSLQGPTYDLNCCFLLKKPVEKILIRYEELPENFMTSIVDNHLSSQRGCISNQLTKHVATNMLITLSKYLHHQRWVWSMQRGPNNSLALPIVSKILSVLTRIRLKEGFHFSHSSFGITYMVMEIPMEVPLNESESESTQIKASSPCVVQYLLFPPHTNTTFRDSMSEEEDSELPESDGELQLITECWIEPQYGITSQISDSRRLSEILYQEISQALFEEDWECISVLTTFEHLCLLCHKKENSNPLPTLSSVSTAANDPAQFPPVVSSFVAETVSSSTPSSVQRLGSSINFVPYSFNVMNLLSKCHQTELLFPTLSQCSNNPEQNEVLDPNVTPNELLFEYFIKNIKLIQDKELLLSTEDCHNFLLQVHHRRNTAVDPVVPFPHPQFLMNNSEVINMQQHAVNCAHCAKLNGRVWGSEQLQEAVNSVPRWRCFLKGCSSSRFLMTVIPATFADLEKLVYHNSLGTSGPQEGLDASPSHSAEGILPTHSTCKGVENSVSSKLPPSSDISPKPPVMLPVYVYDCVLSLVTNELATSDENFSYNDNFECYTFKYEDSGTIEKPKMEGSSVIPSEKRKQDCKKYDKTLLRNYHILMDKAFSKSFVYSVYRSLVLDLPVDKLDAVAAIDEICEESLLEVDITEFIYTICGHVKDFNMKHSVRQQHLASGKSICDKSDPVKQSQNQIVDFSTTIDRVQPNFPLALLQRHQPCEQLQQKHLDIKDRFCEILQCFFKKIPSRPDYYVFCPYENEELSLEEDSFQEPKYDDEMQSDSIVPTETLLEKDTNSNAGNPEEEVFSLNSHMNTQSSFSSLDEDQDSSFSQKNEFSPPLFVHLLCSARSKQDMKSCSMPSLPTCLSDLLQCVDPNWAEIDLNEFRITLDVTCLTLPTDIENPTVSLDHHYSTSFSSSSPVPDSNQYKPVAIKEGSDSSSESLSETVQGIALHNVPSYQREGVYKCIDKIKWLLLDEKASAALSSYPITSETLNMITTHVKNAEDKSCCIVREVPLKFVFGPDSSLSKFTQVFRRLTLPGYHLNEVDNFYYLVLDAESVEKQYHPFGSLNPPLGIASKYLLMQKNLHCDDSTELKKICDEAQTSNRVDDDTLSMEFDFLEKFQSKPLFITLRKKQKLHQFCQEDDTETEDGNDQLSAKTRAIKKPFAKSAKGKLNFPERLLSVPSFPSPEESATLKRACSLPFNLHLCGPGNDSKYQAAQRESSSQSADVSMESMFKSSVSNIEPVSTECIMEWENELPISPHTWDLPLGSGNAHSVSSVPSATKCKNTDNAGSPQFFSDADYASVFGSCHFSNTEDGYDGDSSDTGSDWDWLSVLDTKRPVPPKFWLIMTVDTSKVTIYFHIRHRKKDDDELKQSQAVLSQIIRVITDICKEVNQTLLLQSLHETRMCDRLLVPEENDDIWKKNELDPILGSQRAYLEDRNSPSEVHEKYLEANLRFMPGAFCCAVVWVTYFKLHHRLTSGQAGQKSKGIQAFRTVLNTFSVNNRENMFVYQEGSGSVFYLRLYEENCEDEHSANKPKIEGSLSPSGSSSSSAQNPLQQKTHLENENEGDFRPRVNSGQSDVDRQDLSTAMAATKHVPRRIALYVHGIGEVGNEIKVDLVQVLQNRLNDCILDMIIMMLSRNPLCKLTPEDVQFIQNPAHPPFSEIHFTIPVKLLCYAHSIHMYLRQNMLHFLYNPKYTDSRKENHFKAYSSSTSEWVQVDDNDVFLYHPHQASGYSGSKGIACIILSLVTGQGHPFEHLGNSLPNPSAYQDGFSENDFEELTSTKKHVLKKAKTPGPVALIRYQIWNVGKDTVEHIESRLHDAVRHALWDLLMEYMVLTAPVSDSFAEDDLSCYSEPTTPIRMRRTGRAAVEHSLKAKEFTSPLSLYNSKEISSSVPDIVAKSQSPQPSLQNAAVFQFSGPQTAKGNLCSEMPHSASSGSPSYTQTVQDPDKCNLNYIFHSVMKSFLHFGSQLGCPALFKRIFNLPSRYSISVILNEIQSIVNSTVRDLNFRVFIRVTNAMNADTEFVPFIISPDTLSGEVEDNKPGTKRNFIVVGRNNKQWKSYMGLADFTRFHDVHSDALKSYQRFHTHICNPVTSDRLQDSTAASPTSVCLSNSVSALSSPRIKSPSINVSELPSSQGPASSVFVPRQRLLLMLIQDKKLTVFMYNWSQDTTTTFLKHLTKLVEWHESRSALLNNVIMQKLGLFNGQTFPVHMEKSEKIEKIEMSRRPSYHNVVLTWKQAEQLFQHHSPPRELPNTTSSRSSAISAALPPVLEILKNNRPPMPLHLSKYSSVKDPVTKHGSQVQDICNAQRRDMQELRSMWQARDTSFHNPYAVDRLLLLLKRAARLSHYCLTPILFNPSWRWKVAPIRDHTVQPLEPLPLGLDKSPSDSNVSTSRSRHSSGSSLKNAEGASGSTTNASRSRRASGATVQTSTQSSPKIRMKNPSEETWHQTVCNHYLMEYMQYLQTLGFVSLQTKESPHGQGSRRSVANGEGKYSKLGGVPLARTNLWGPFHLVRYQLGGLLLFEVGLCDPYAYGHLYTIDCSRLHTDASTRAFSSQFTSAFLDEVDKIKSMMHLHSFTYDYHLRTIHSYISGRQLIFRHGYHLTSFLDDFIKYYQKSPNCARNLLFAGTITITDISMSGHQLYNYIISHNQLYGMTVLRMVPIIQESSLMMHTEFVLVELSARKTSYKDSNDVCQMGSFDIGLLINHNTDDVSADRNTLVLNYYIILTSQRELFPKLENFGTTLGSFQTVRFASSQTSSAYSSRKTSTVSLLPEKDKFESSGEETSSGSSDSRSRKAASVLGITDEEVTYLGYFSSQETMMQQVLLSEADSAQTHLKGVFHRAAIHCRRDFLWSALLPRSFKEEEGGGKDTHTSTISYSEFSELLDLVSSVPLDDIDDNLRPFLNMHVSWYKSLVSVLKIKYADSHREFWCPDQNTLHIAVSHNRCPDSFMLLSVNFQAMRAELCLVFREPPTRTEHTPDKPSQRVLALQSLVEEFVNVCCFQLWSTMIG